VVALWVETRVGRGGNEPGIVPSSWATVLGPSSSITGPAGRVSQSGRLTRVKPATPLPWTSATREPSETRTESGKGTMSVSGSRLCRRHPTASVNRSPSPRRWTRSIGSLHAHSGTTGHGRSIAGPLSARRWSNPSRSWPRHMGSGRDRNPWGLAFDDEESGER
jgi:hypothetical protein